MTKSNLAPVVSVLNMKGGVGKTTISAHVMRVLYHRHRKKTLLVDLDPQFNLTQALLSRKAYGKLRQEELTIFAAMEPDSNGGLHDIAVSTKPPPSPDSITHQLRQFRGGHPTLELLPGDFRLVKYAMISNKTKLDSVQKRFLRFLGMARKQYDLICIDCNPSSSFITHCALHACSHLLVPVRPDRYSILGLELLSDFVQDVPTIHPKPAMMVLLNGIPRSGYDPTVENELRGHGTFGGMTLAIRIRVSSLLRARADYTGFATDRPVPWRNLLRREISAVVDELIVRLGL